MALLTFFGTASLVSASAHIGTDRPYSARRLASRRLNFPHDAKKQTTLKLLCKASPSLQQNSETAEATSNDEKLEITGMHHVGLLCENLERSVEFYQGILGLELNADRPTDKLPYRGAWFWVGDEMIHLMELPNPDPVSGRPEHGGRDRHACVSIKSVEPLKQAFEKAGVAYTMSKSGRPALFARDPDGNALEFTQV